MRSIEFLLHFLTPRESNNHRAKALHLSAISFYIALLMFFQVGLSVFARFQPGVLGYASNINVSDLLTDTNKAREAAGLPSFNLDSELTTAAQAKAADMFAHQYWAHTSPQGRDPWSFITAAGYNYLFAGENLARDFGDSQSVVTAWMNSPSHRDNMLNDRYHDIGFAVVNGEYNGYQTTLVVQMFGARASGIPTVSAPSLPEQRTASVSTASGSQLTPAPSTPGAGIILTTNPKPPIKIDVVSLTRSISLALVLILSGVLVVDGLLIYRRRTVRLSGHNLAHLLILIAVLVGLNLIGRGVIL